MGGKMRLMAAVCFLALIALDPASAMRATREAFSAWTESVAPALLPFMIVLPALTGEEMRRLMSRAMGRMMRPLFGCPGEAAAAAAIGWLAGSPAGAAAMSRMAGGMTRAELTRGALLASGASPMFLLSAVSVGMLGAPGAGWLLVRSQLGAALLVGMALSHVRVSADAPANLCAAAVDEPVRPVRSAVTGLLAICGYMAFFSVLARQLALLMGWAFETPLLALMEMAGGCDALARLPMGLNARLALISAAASFGGLSVYMQCMAYVKPLGANPWGYLGGKLMQALVAAALTRAQLQFMPVARAAFAPAGESLDPAALAAVAAAALLLMGMVSLRNLRVSK